MRNLSSESRAVCLAQDPSVFCDGSQFVFMKFSKLYSSLASLNLLKTVHSLLKLTRQSVVAMNNSGPPSHTSKHQTDQTLEFPFTESNESKFYRNFLKKWDEFYPDSAERSVEMEEDQGVDEAKNQAETEDKAKTEKKNKPEERIEKETITLGTDQPKKIYDYKSKKYVEQN